MPLKLPFVLTASFALGLFVAGYAGLRYPLRVTDAATLDPNRAFWIVLAADVVWFFANAYAVYLVHSTWDASARGLASASLFRCVCLVVRSVPSQRPRV